MSNMYALLIGIDHYLPNQLPNGLYYKSLLGCVQDVNNVEAFFRQRLGISEEQIIKLTSSNADGPVPLEPPAHWPTYKNIVEAFSRLETMSQAGDQIYIHYSGHGGRCRTSPEFYELKGVDGLDEVLVPMDLGNSEGNYLRDTELHFLLQRLIDQQRYVTIVLDSCHAGGATRKPLVDPTRAGAGVRGPGKIDEAPPPFRSVVATPEQLKQAWNTAKNATHSVKSGSEWLLEPKDYVLIAACRAAEYANEYSFNGHVKNGALSYWLLDTLKQMRPGFTYKMLHDRVLAKVHSQFIDQTPQLQGEGNRVVFGREEILPQQAVLVISRDAADQITLNAGQAHGVGPGAKFHVFALYETDFEYTNARIAIVEVTESEAISSKAKILDSFGNSEIEPGCQAVLFNRGLRRLCRRVRLTTSDVDGLNSFAAKAIEQMRRLLADTSNGFIRIATAEESADYLVTIEDDKFVICDSGGLEIENLEPEIPIREPDAVTRLLERLVHLAKYFNVRELDNGASQSPLAGKMSVELTGPFDDASSVKDGKTIVLRVQNNSDWVLNVTVLDLQPDWGISQVYPARGAFESLDPGKAFELPMKVGLPRGYQKGTDVLKIFGTIETTSFRWFELLPLDRGEQRSNALQKLLGALASGKSITRQVQVLAGPELEWIVVQKEIETRAN